MMTFFERLTQLCEEKGISRRKLEEETELSIGATSKWKDGTKLPNSKSQKIIADYFNVSIDYLMGRDQSKQVNDYRMTTKECAELMQCSEQFIRVGIQQERLPFGYAVKMNNRWCYYISAIKFYECTGIKPRQIKKALARECATKNN